MKIFSILALVNNAGSGRNKQRKRNVYVRHAWIERPASGERIVFAGSTIVHP
jgi:N12 class adenine-specific DNA methylase